MFSIFSVSGSALSAQSQRLNVVASNLANVDAVAGPDGESYKSRQVVFQTAPMGDEGAAGVKVSKRVTPLGARCIRPSTLWPMSKAMSPTPTSVRSMRWWT